VKRILLILFFITQPCKADLFGGDVVVLTQILANALQQLSQLRGIVGAADNQLDLVRQINQGINDSIQILKEVHPNLDPGIYRDWRTVNQALEGLNGLYGQAPRSPEMPIHQNVDRGIAEAISYNNSFYKYSREMDVLAVDIQRHSHAVSPGGAAKLTAQALGAVIQVLNQNLRAQATLLKLTAQDMAVRNRAEKMASGHLIRQGQELRQLMKQEPAKFEVPRF